MRGANKEEVKIDPLNLGFAKVMELTTYVGLVIMVIFGLLYLIGLPGFANMKLAIANWHLPVKEFWKATNNIEVHGYSWFIVNLKNMDCLSMIGICILALAPGLGLISALVHSRKQKIYLIFFIILIIEFTFAILKPIILPQLGGH